MIPGETGLPYQASRTVALRIYSDMNLAEIRKFINEHLLFRPRQCGRAIND